MPGAGHLAVSIGAPSAAEFTLNQKFLQEQPQQRLLEQQPQQQQQQFKEQPRPLAFDILRDFGNREDFGNFGVQTTALDINGIPASETGEVPSTRASPRSRAGQQNLLNFARGSERGEVPGTRASPRSRAGQRDLLNLARGKRQASSGGGVDLTYESNFEKANSTALAINGIPASETGENLLNFARGSERGEVPGTRASPRSRAGQRNLLDLARGR